MDAFLDSLRQEGTSDSEGVFSLDHSQFREKSALFQKQRSDYFLLRLVQGMVEMRPRELVITSSRRALSLKANLPTRPAALQPTSHLFSGHNTLSQGLLTCFLAGFAGLELRSEEGRFRVDDEGKGLYEYEPLNKAFAVRLRLGRGFFGKLLHNAKRALLYHRSLSTAAYLGGCPHHSRRATPKSRPLS